MYLTRTLEKSIQKVSDFFPVLLVTGPRQVGKTTILQACGSEGRNYISLDTLENRSLAQNDPALFLQRFKAPLLIDEIQYAPQLFPYIKAAVDEQKQSGMYWLTGSQQFHLMKNVSESLAGRVGILHLEGFSQAERDGQPERRLFLPTPKAIEARAAFAPKTDIEAVFHQIWKGSYPRMHEADDDMWQFFYDAYVQTYIERDIRDLGSVGNELDFLKFMKVLAARSRRWYICAYSQSVGIHAPDLRTDLHTPALPQQHQQPCDKNAQGVLHGYRSGLLPHRLECPADAGKLCHERRTAGNICHLGNREELVAQW